MEVDRSDPIPDQKAVQDEIPKWPSAKPQSNLRTVAKNVATTGLDGLTPGQSVTITALAASYSAEGTLTLYNGSTPLGTVPLALQPPQDAQYGGTMTINSLPLGTNAITGTYSGDLMFAPNTSPVLYITVGSPVSTEGRPKAGATGACEAHHWPKLGEVLQFRGMRSLYDSTVIPAASRTVKNFARPALLRKIQSQTRLEPILFMVFCSF